MPLLDRLAPNRAFPVLDRGYLVNWAGAKALRAARFLYRHSWRAREFFDAAEYDAATSPRDS